MHLTNGGASGQIRWQDVALLWPYRGVRRGSRLVESSNLCWRILKEYFELCSVEPSPQRRKSGLAHEKASDEIRTINARNSKHPSASPHRQRGAILNRLRYACPGTHSFFGDCTKHAAPPSLRRQGKGHGMIPALRHLLRTADRCAKSTKPSRSALTMLALP